jgi:hypothetical protein
VAAGSGPHPMLFDMVNPEVAVKPIVRHPLAEHAV